MISNEIEDSGLCDKVFESQEKCCFESVEPSRDMIAVVHLSEQSRKLKRQVMKYERALFEGERNLHTASSVILTAHYIATDKCEEVCKT